MASPVVVSDELMVLLQKVRDLSVQLQRQQAMIDRLSREVRTLVTYRLTLNR